MSKLADNEFYVADRNEWRAWLDANWNKAKNVWLIFYKKHSRKPTISYDEAVEEAICFGWVDGVIRRLDDERCVRKFMPRRVCSRWSESNKKRAQKMIDAGRMTEAGLLRINEAKKSGEWYRKSEIAKDLKVPDFFLCELRRNKKAFSNFDKLTASSKRLHFRWVLAAKREETRKRRLAEIISVLEQNKKLGLK